MEEGKRLRRMLVGLTALLCLAVGLCGALHLREAELRREIAMQQQREMADVIAAMADIEVNLSKLLVASGARQSVSLLGETAILAQHVESGLSRLTAGERATGDANSPDRWGSIPWRWRRRFRMAACSPGRTSGRLRT